MLAITGEMARGAGAPDAPQQFGALRQAAHEAHQRGDKAAYLEGSKRLYEFLNASPQARLQLIAAELFAGDSAAALSSLHDYVVMGGSYDDALKDQRFDALRAQPGFGDESAGMAKNAAPESHSTRQLALEPAEFVPEDIDYDAPSDTFFITSVLNRSIISVRHLKDVHTFAMSPDSWPMMAIKVDGARGHLWATEIAAGEGQSAVLEYDLHGNLLKRLPGPKGSQFGDMALEADGAVLVADGEGGGIYRVAAAEDRLRRIDRGDFVSPQTPCPLPDGRILIPDYVRGIGSLDPKSGRVQWLRAPRHQLDGIDGLYRYGRTLIATQNGASPERVVRFDMDPTLLHVESEYVIERSTPTLGDPTHGVVVGKYFYYLANSGWPGLDEHARKKTGAVLSAPLLMRAPLAP
ncbi:MAG TPA: hypothetical protein VGI93_24580 [Steroidobacteraceae bacterium]|jgi:streptogramin lyase